MEGTLTGVPFFHRQEFEQPSDSLRQAEETKEQQAADEGGFFAAMRSE